MNLSPSARIFAATSPGREQLDPAPDWRKIGEELDVHGCAIISGQLSADDCAALAASYDSDGPFRSRIVMSRHGFGRGEYKYFAYPLPEAVSSLREALYPPLTEIANRWNAAMNIDVRYPAQHDDFLARCHSAGQTKPTPLLLQYGEGDYNNVRACSHAPKSCHCGAATVWSFRSITGRCKAHAAPTGSTCAMA